MTDAVIPQMANVPLAQPNLGPLEVELVNSVLKSDTLAMGPMTERFEEAMAEVVGRHHAVACSSGTAGLHMVVRGLGVGDGDEVITTPFSFVASANCVLYERATVKFVDIEEETLGLDPTLVEGAITPNTRAVLAVDVFGNACKLEELRALADARELTLIEDSCEALGSSLRGRPLGSFGDAGVFAFYPNKQITTGEGGVVVTDDPKFAKLLRSLRNQGRDEDGTWLRHIRLGFNYRMDELSAALGVAQLQRIAELKIRRAEIARTYERLLDQYEWVTTPYPAPGADIDWFVYVVRFDPAVDRNQLIVQLASAGIPSRPYFSPIHLQPFYMNEFGYRPGDFPVTERVAASTLALPFSTRLTSADVERVVSAVATAVGQQAAG